MNYLYTKERRRMGRPGGGVGKYENENEEMSWCVLLSKIIGLHD